MAATEIVIQIPLETKWTKWRVELDRWRRCYSFMQLQFGHHSKLGEMPIPMPEKRQLKNEIRFHSSEAQHFSFLCASRPKMSPMLLRLGVCLAMVSSAALFAFCPDPFGDRAYLNSRWLASDTLTYKYDGYNPITSVFQVFLLSLARRLAFGVGAICTIQALGMETLAFPLLLGITPFKFGLAQHQVGVVTITIWIWQYRD